MNKSEYTVSREREIPTHFSARLITFDSSSIYLLPRIPLSKVLCKNPALRCEGNSKIILSIVRQHILTSVQLKYTIYMKLLSKLAKILDRIMTVFNKTEYFLSIISKMLTKNLNRQIVVQPILTARFPAISSTDRSKFCSPFQKEEAKNLHLPFKK